MRRVSRAAGAGTVAIRTSAAAAASERETKRIEGARPREAGHDERQGVLDIGVRPDGGKVLGAGKCHAGQARHGACLEQPEPRAVPRPLDVLRILPVAIGPHLFQMIQQVEFAPLFHQFELRIVDVGDQLLRVKVFFDIDLFLVLFRRGFIWRRLNAV